MCAALCNAFQVHCWLARTRGGDADPLRPCEGRGTPAPRPGGGQGAHPASPGQPALSPKGAAGAPDPRHASPHLLLSSVRPAPRAPGGLTVTDLPHVLAVLDAVDHL